MSEASLAWQLQALVRPGDTLWWGSATAEPLTRARAVALHRRALAQDGRLRVFVGIGGFDTLQPEHADAIDFFGYAAGGPYSKLAEADVLDILPSHYSHLPGLIREGLLPVDVLLQVSKPDRQDRYSLGLVHEYLPAALKKAWVVIGSVNPDIPRMHGSVYLKAGDFALLVNVEHPPVAPVRTTPGPAELVIARHIAVRVEDGATLHVGIGNLPGALLSALHGHRDPGFQLRETGYTHDPQVLTSSYKLTAINSAIEVDVTGQINAEVAGGIYVGAAADFLRGAGLPIVPLPATAKGALRIVAQLSRPVSTPRSDAARSLPSTTWPTCAASHCRAAYAA